MKTEKRYENNNREVKDLLGLQGIKTGYLNSLPGTSPGSKEILRDSLTNAHLPRQFKF